MLKQAVFSMAQGSGLNAWLRARTRAAFRIVTYHGVDEQDESVVNFDHLQIQPRLFTRHLEALARVYRPIPLREAVEGFLAGRGWPERGLAVTFDDGYTNNLQIAAPILRRLGIPATFFVTAGFVEGRARPWWYDLREAIAAAAATELLLPGEAALDLRTEEARCVCCRGLEWAWASLPEEDRARRLAEVYAATATPERPLRYPFMNRGEAQQLARLGFDLEPHGDSHCSMRGESAERVKHEVRRSAAFTRELTGRAPCCLAWPHGHIPATRALAESALAEGGVSAAVSTATGYNDAGADRLALRRWDLHGGYSVAAVQARLSGFTCWWRAPEASQPG